MENKALMSRKNNLIGILLLPFVIGYLISFGELLNSLRPSNLMQAAFLSGVFAYILLHFFILKPTILSTIAHELNHTIWGLAFGAKLHGMRLNKNGGSVSLSKSNTAITLAPYFFPLYTAVLAALTFLVEPKYLLAASFLIGLTLSMHIIFTIESLRIRQPDIFETGVFLSVPLIVVGNVLVITLILNLISPETIHVKSFIWRGMSSTLKLLENVIGLL